MKYTVTTQHGKGEVDIPRDQDPRTYLVKKFGRREVLAYECAEKKEELAK